MKTTIEISMYPLQEDYAKPILDFINDLKSAEGVRVKVNALSTQIQGDFDTVHKHLSACLKRQFETGLKISFVMKHLPGELDLDYSHGDSAH
jgi:uncharacterized protein YqgV (UPF0045/DUF77 family)